MYGYKEEDEKKKKKYKNNPEPSGAVGKENEMGSETLTATYESKSFNDLRTRLSSVANFDQELGN